jgi:hypothetical protein
VSIYEALANARFWPVTDRSSKVASRPKADNQRGDSTAAPAQHIVRESNMATHKIGKAFYQCIPPYCV